VILSVEPFDKVPVAANCWVEPTNKLAGGTGVTAIEDNVGAGAAYTDGGVVGTAIFTERFSVVGPPPASKVAVTPGTAVPLT